MARGAALIAVAVLAALTLTPLTATAAGPSASTSVHRPAAPAELRVNQQGYLPRETKQARLMAAHPVGPTSYVVSDQQGDVLLRGRVPSQPVGGWNGDYHAVYVIDLSRLHHRGTYRITTTGGARAVSPWFRVAGAQQLFGALLGDGIAFDQVQRDGADVVTGPLDRQPSHLNDATAQVYQWPRMQPGSDLILDPTLTPTGASVDAEGGWFDAGDYLKFTHSTAYNDVLLFTAAQLLGKQAPPALLAEAEYGEAWLRQMWHDQTAVLYLQVGIGSGNQQGTFVGDHDLWRLPQADDADSAPGHQYVAHRPVFAANQPDQPISPNLVGRVCAALALAAQADAATDQAKALDELQRAEVLWFDAATKHPPHPLVTALPHAFYPETSWYDDMALGGAEIAIAAHRLHLPWHLYLDDSGHWMSKYLHASGQSNSRDTLNLYDTGALAEFALATAMKQLPARRVPVTRDVLVRDLQRQVQQGITQAGTDPFGAPVDQTEFDANSHSYGLISTVALYDLLTHTHRYQPFASAVRTWLLGGDAWGVSSMVGVGTDFPDCMQHQVANLSGTIDGTPPVDVGAVVNGPNGAGNFQGGLGGPQDDMRSCGQSGLTAFDGHGSRYVDDVRAWQTDEPALDMTGSAILAAAAELRAVGGR